MATDNQIDASDNKARNSVLTDNINSDEEMSLLDFVNVVIYQRRWFALVAGLITLFGLVIIFLLPRIYISESSIMLEREGIYSTSTSTQTQDSTSLRLHAIIKTILSTSSVEEILSKFDFIDETTPKEEVLAEIVRFRSNASFEFDNVSVLREQTGREGLYSMGLTVSYESPSPDLSYKVTRELTDRLLGSNEGKMSAENQVQYSYLKDKLADLEVELSDAELEVAKYKEANALALPEMKDVAMERIDDLRYRILNSEDRLKVMRDRKEETQALLASVAIDTTVFSTEGQRIISPEDQLEMLLVDYAATKDKYSASHPDRIAMEEQIAALRQHVGRGDEEGVELDLTLAKQELASLKNRYSSNHPDVQALEEKISFMDKQLASGRKRTRDEVGQTTNPIYNNLQSRLRGLTAEITLELDAQRNLEGELEEVERRFKRTPEVEARLRRLTKERDRVEKQFLKIENEMDELESSSERQQAELVERFVLLEAPDIPLEPAKPNKMILIPLLFIFAFAIAYLAAFVRHYLQAKIFASEDVEKVTDLPVFLIPEFK